MVGILVPLILGSIQLFSLNSTVKVFYNTFPGRPGEFINLKFNVKMSLTKEIVRRRV